MSFQVAVQSEKTKAALEEAFSQHGLKTRCTTLRNKRIGFGTLQEGIKQYVRMVEPCDTPLWSDEEKQTGKCEGCTTGWEVSGNFRVKESD